jgi:hypothetical protein
MRKSITNAALRCLCAVLVFFSCSVAADQQLKRVPIGWAPQPHGTPLRMTLPRTDGAGFATTVTNEGDRTIVGLTFVAIAEVVGSGRPVQVLNSSEWSVSLAPTQTVAVGAEWLTSTDVDRLLADAAPRRVQMFIAPATIRFADGTQWTLRLDPLATTAFEATQRAFNLPDGSSR